MLDTPLLTSAVAAIEERVRAFMPRLEDGFPHLCEIDTWTTTEDGDWTGGFYVGQLWLTAATRKDPDSLEAAQTWSRALQGRAQSQTIFRGFLFWYGAALGRLLLGDEAAGVLAEAGAQELADSFHPSARLLPLGAAAEEASDVGADETNIDGVPGGTPLLAWAAERFDDPKLREKAMSHVDQHSRLLIRDDGSVVQSASLDASTGEALRTYTHKGVADDSTWARAQAWAMLGLAQSTHWLDGHGTTDAARVADWWLDNIPEGYVPWYDFDAPDTYLDTSAAAIAAAALLKLSQTSLPRAPEYRVCAVRTVQALSGRHLTGVGVHDSARPRGRLIDACYNARIGLAVSAELIWGNYFLHESVLHLLGDLDSARL